MRHYITETKTCSILCAAFDDAMHNTLLITDQTLLVLAIINKMLRIATDKTCSVLFYLMKYV